MQAIPRASVDQQLEVREEALDGCCDAVLQHGVAAALTLVATGAVLGPGSRVQSGLSDGALQTLTERQHQLQSDVLQGQLLMSNHLADVFLRQTWTVK